MGKNITTIPVQSPMLVRKRVAAYARVSSGKDAMLESLSAQVSHYSRLIQSRPEWVFAGVYADEALTGTKDARPQFQQLIADCKSGNIDMIITKAISRFARNTVTTLKYVRELKEQGVAVYFEEENINTLSEGGELLLTVLSAFAQEQSLNASEDCKWRIEKQFQSGEMPMSLQRLYGYKRTTDGGFEIVPDEAEIVRYIYNRYMEGSGAALIARELNEKGIPAPKGEHWNCNGLYYILSSEKYIGDLRLQKFYVDNHINKRKCINRGEKPQYYIENDHEPIISRELFEAVQNERKRRAAVNCGRQPTESYPFTGKILCEACGRNYTRKSGKYRVNWQCATYLQQGKTACAAKQIPEDVLVALTEELGGIDKISKIRVLGNNRLVFSFYDGTEVERMWQDRSRRESWTEEMRESARQKRLQGRGRTE